MSDGTIDLRDVARDLVRAALAAGARAADAVVGDSDGLDVGVRLGEVEKLTRARERRVGLRVFVGDATAIVSSGDFAPRALHDLAHDAVALARCTAPDPWAGLPDPALLATTPPDLDLHDPAVEALDVETALARAREGEAAARDASPEIRNSEGAEYAGGWGTVAYASSHDFAGTWTGSHVSLVVTPVAERDGAMQRDYWWASRRHLADMPPAVDVGREAARRTLRRLGARKVATGSYPIVFDPDTAASLLRHLAAAISGPALYRRASYLLGQLGETIAAPGVTIVDDPLIPRAMASRPFDGEGVASRRRTIVDGGRLESYLLDAYSARRLGLAPTGHASRATGDAPGVAPTNFRLQPGAHTPEAIIASVPQGLYVTELMGFGINLVTGDYSRGAAGVWIDGGQLAYPVEELTIAGNLRDIFRDVEMIGDDLPTDRATASPTLKIARMTIAGS